ncbi:hypothetical protein Daus18300_011151 [Diaporthe australafricana]|uniref:C2H2-type domain-containing protein n=1 Tax=Diaporthe australafricana TaxID=127596 RepID=A0ABR3W847_9PEZI
MNNNEKLELGERVERASEAQAKLTLKFMILKCRVTDVTIGRAIKDAVERQCPTPHVVYEDPGPADEVEAASAPATPHKQKKKKKKKDHSGDSENEEDLPNAISTKHSKTKRGDINPDPLISRLIVKKAKSKLKGNRNASDNHDKRYKKLKSSTRKKKKRVSENEVAADQQLTRAIKVESGGSSSPVVIDLVTSSDSELSDSDRPENKTAGGDPSVQAKSGHDIDLQEQERKTNRKPPGKLATLNTKQESHDLRGGIWVNISNKKKAEKAIGSVPPVSTALTKKRKAKEHDERDADDDQSHSPALKVKRSKRSKGEHPREPQSVSKSLECRKCRVKFPSLRRLSKHFQKCLITPYVPVATPLRNASSPHISAGPQSLQKVEHSSEADVKVSTLQTVLVYFAI